MPRPLAFLLIVAACGALDIVLHMAGGDLMPMARSSAAMSMSSGGRQ